MLVRDLLVTLPGILTPTVTSARDTTVALEATLGGGTSGLLTPWPGDATGPHGAFFTAEGESTVVAEPFKIAPLQTAPALTLTQFHADRTADGDGPDLPPTDGGDGNGDSDGENGDPLAPLPHLDLSVTAEAGRVLHLDLPDSDAGSPVASVRILSQGAHGHLSVDPDHSLSLVLSEDPTALDPLDLSYEITYADGRSQTVATHVSLTPSQVENGWGKGEFYMLEEGSDGRVVVEHGENHRKIHVTAGDHGLDAADIARIEKISAGAINADWLIAHPEYGATPETALSVDLGMALWDKMTTWHQRSDWLLFERGHDYAVGRIVGPAASGESALNPLYIGAYGTGTDPVMQDSIRLFQRDSDHIVVQDLDLRAGLLGLQGSNLLMDHVDVSGQGSVSIQNMERVTLHDVTLIDIIREKPVDDSGRWEAHTNRMVGAYIAETEGVLIEGGLMDHIGWGDGYDPNVSADYPQPPSMFSQNLYLQYDNLDVTMRDNIVMRAASFGAQVRSGGVIEDNLFLDNNAAVSALGGNYANAGYVGNFSLLLGNVITSAGHKRVSEQEGGLSIGIDASGVQSSLIDNIVAHLADPENPAEIAHKQVLHDGLNAPGAYYDDTIVHNWQVAGKPDTTPDQNTDGLDTAVLDQTTIQNFTAELLGKDSATIADLGDYLRAQADGKLDHVVDADLINAWFREGFGLATTLRADEATLRFIPDDRGEGMRWDNRLNWSTDDLPGTQDGDSVDLGGNRVLFGAKTVTVDDFIFGDHGQLKATSGRLDIDGGVSVGDHGGLLEIGNAGQVWMAGYLDSDMLAIEVGGGRFANKGAFAGAVDLDLSGDGQALLAVAGSSFDLQDGSSISVAGSKARAGFDGGDGGSAVLRLHDGASLSFAADQTGFGSLSEFYSGAYEASNVTSGIRLDGDLAIDLSGWTAAPEAQKWVLAKADQLIGSFDGLDIAGLDSDRDALVRVDYVADTVTLILSADGAGSGRVRMVEAGEADFIDYTKDAALTALWTALHQDAPAVSDVPF